MEKEEEKTLVQELGLEETHILVHETADTEIYAHTIYYEVPKFDYEQFITEDDTPVDNLFSEVQQRLYIDPLHANQWTNRTFMACSNVGIYYENNMPAVVPDMFLSFDVTKPKTWDKKKDKCYFLWLMKKPPELVIEIVSNKIGGENTSKFAIYAQMGVLYYIIHDPYKHLYHQELNIFQLVNGQYEPYQENNYMPEITLGLMMWEGIFEGSSAPYIRWCNKEGNILRTGAEGIAEETQKAKEAEEKAEQEAQKAKEAEEKAETEKRRAEAEAKKARQAEKKAEKEAKKAELLAQEKKQAETKAYQEAQRAELLLQEKEAEYKRALEAEAKVQELLKRLKEMGLEPAE